MPCTPSDPVVISVAIIRGASLQRTRSSSTSQKGSQKKPKKIFVEIFADAMVHRSTTAVESCQSGESSDQESKLDWGGANGGNLMEIGLVGVCQKCGLYFPPSEQTPVIAKHKKSSKRKQQLCQAFLGSTSSDNTNVLVDNGSSRSDSSNSSSSNSSSRNAASPKPLRVASGEIFADVVPKLVEREIVVLCWRDRGWKGRQFYGRALVDLKKPSSIGHRDLRHGKPGTYVCELDLQGRATDDDIISGSITIEFVVEKVSSRDARTAAAGGASAAVTETRSRRFSLGRYSPGPTRKARAGSSPVSVKGVLQRPLPKSQQEKQPELQQQTAAEAAPISTRSFFGTSLADISEHESSGFYADADVPSLLKECCAFIMRGEEGYGRPNLFRIAPSISQVNSLQRLLEAVPLSEPLMLSDNIENGNTHVAAALLKKFLRLLSPRLLPAIADLQLAIKAIETSGESNDCLELFRSWLFGGAAVDSLLQPLGGLESKALVQVVECLRAVSDFPSNNMDSGAIAVIIAPNLFKETSLEATALAAENESKVLMTKWLIDHADNLGIASSIAFVESIG